MSSPSLSRYSIRIKNIYIELKNYTFSHSPFFEDDQRFIGRKKVKQRIVTILNKSNSKAGAYLITGFRGMGKTSVIRQALNDYNNSKGVAKRYNFTKIFRVIKRCFSYIIGLLFFQRISEGKINYFQLDNNIQFNNWYTGGVILFCVISLITTFYLPEINDKNTSKNKDTIKKLFELSLLALMLFIITLFSFSSLLIAPRFWISPSLIDHLDWISFILMIITALLGYSFIQFALNTLNLKYKLRESSNNVINKLRTIRLDTLSNAIWNFYKLIATGFIFTGLLLYFIDPRKFCDNMIFCLDFSANWDSILVKSNDSKFLIIRSFFGILIAYSVISIALFINDLLYQIVTAAMNWLGQSRSSEKISEQYESFEINLSQESLNEIDLLRRMTNNLFEYWKENRIIFSNPLYNRKFYFLWSFILNKLRSNHKRDLISKYDEVLYNLDDLKKRISGQVTRRKELSANPNITTGIQGGLTRIAFPLGNISNKDEVAYPIATPKEIEDQLAEIIKDIDDIRKSKKYPIKQFLFVIDELDKIEPHGSATIQDRESSNPIFDNNNVAKSQFRQRQEAVARLLANLKGFLNVTRAKFFFVGGREMFDADLADIADRDSFYSSIFNDVIYVESFFKDSLDIKGGVTQMTESYLCKIILSDLKGSEDHAETLQSLYNKLTISKKESNSAGVTNFNPICLSLSNGGEPLAYTEEENVSWRDSLRLDSEELKFQKYKLIYTLQNYIIYLTYRSNGTPKKLSGLTEQLITCGPKPKQYLAFSKDTIDKKNNFQFLRDNIVVLHNNNNNNKGKKYDKDGIVDDPLFKDLSESLFIKFSFSDQYEIGLTSNIYRPYLISNSRHLKDLGDKLQFSSSFIIDHLLKFHPFGFSWRNLELIPEVILLNREPNLRRFIEDLIQFYSLTHIRTTISGIFEYRFRSIIRKELLYLSKTSDLSSAAFNFTLDESLLIKRHYKKKLIELQGNYQNYNPLDGDNQFIHSICFIQTILGNLYFYDKEYDEAIVFYTESIQALRMPKAIANRTLTRHQFLLWLRNMLKLGLTLEKIQAYDSALSFYRTLILDTKRFLFNITTYKNPSKSEIHRTAHWIYMPFVAFLTSIEKARYDGITYSNLVQNHMEFLSTLNEFDTKLSADLIDQFRKDFLEADYYNNVGGILYYKNVQFPSLYPDLEKYSTFPKTLLSIKSKKILNQQVKIYARIKTKGNPDFQPSLPAFSYYWNALETIINFHEHSLIKSINASNPYSALELCAALILPECTSFFNSNRYNYLATIVAKLGDCILSSLDSELIKIPSIRIDVLDIYLSKDDIQKSQILKFSKELGLSVQKNLFSIPTVIQVYKLAAHLFLLAGDNYSYSLQLKKILYIYKDILEIEKLALAKSSQIFGFSPGRFMIEVQKIAEQIFHATTWNNETANRPQILKYRKIFDILHDKNVDRNLIYNNINNTTDNREVVILVESIKLKLKNVKQLKSSKINYLKDFGIGKSIISAYNSINNRYLRILELKYRSERSYFIIKDVLHLGGLLSINFNEFHFSIMLNGVKSSSSGYKDEFKDYFSKLFDEKSVAKSLNSILGKDLSQKVSIGEIYTFLVKESLFCLRELIKMIKLYDPGYIIGYSYIAEAHNRMGGWCYAYQNYIDLMSQIVISETKIAKHAKTKIEIFTEKKKKAQKEMMTANNELAQAKANIQIAISAAKKTRRKFRVSKINFDKTINEIQRSNDALNKALKMYEELKLELDKIKDEKASLEKTENKAQITKVAKIISEEEKKYSRAKKAINASQRKVDKLEINLTKKEALFRKNKMAKDHADRTLEQAIKSKNVAIAKKVDFTNALNAIINIIIEQTKKQSAAITEASLANNLESKFKTDIEEALGSHNIVYLESKNHYESAIQYYYKIIQLHTSGKSYKEQLPNLYLLEDDYNDNLTHFTIAAERLRVNTGDIRRKISQSKAYIKTSKLYDYDSYLESSSVKHNSKDAIQSAIHEIAFAVTQTEKQETLRNIDHSGLHNTMKKSAAVDLEYYSYSELKTLICKIPSKGLDPTGKKLKRDLKAYEQDSINRISSNPEIIKTFMLKTQISAYLKPIINEALEYANSCEKLQKVSNENLYLYLKSTPELITS